MSRIKWQHALVLIVMLFSCFSAMGKKPVLKNTTWTAVQKMFVADAGTMTITHTLEFGPGKDVRIREVGVMPSYPAMRMNPDGSVDMMPGWTNEREENGKYKVGKGMLTVKLESGGEKVYLLEPDGTMTTPDPLVHEVLVFTKTE